MKTDSKRRSLAEERLKEPFFEQIGKKEESYKNFTAAICSVVVGALLVVLFMVVFPNFASSPTDSAYAVSGSGSAASTSAQSSSGSTDGESASGDATGTDANSQSPVFVRHSTSDSGKWTPIAALTDDTSSAGGYYDYGSSSSSSGSGSSDEGDHKTWHEGWTETIVHPAVTETVDAYDSYICETCGYESLDLSDIIDHIEEEEHEGYYIVEHPEIEIVVEEEWVEVIEHEGYWE